jgi:hypothetical protein
VLDSQKINKDQIIFLVVEGIFCCALVTAFVYWINHQVTKMIRSSVQPSPPCSYIPSLHSIPCLGCWFELRVHFSSS